MKPQDVHGENDYCELGIWIGLAPAIDTFNAERRYFYAGIHVHARKAIGGRKVIDTNFPAVRIKDRTGHFPKIPSEGVLVTSPAALEYLYYMEHQCPVNALLGVECLESQGVPRSQVDLTAIVKCKHCQALHEDIGDFFGENLHVALAAETSSAQSAILFRSSRGLGAGRLLETGLTRRTRSSM